jgi:hypothetical protein
MKVQCTCSCQELAKNDCVWAEKGQKWNQFKSPKIRVWGTMTASGVSELHVSPPNQTERAKYNQENILPLFLPDDMNKTGDTGKVTERRFMKTS